MRVDIQWEGPYKLEQLADIADPTKDYGIYQIYGNHPVYGASVLLYIGLAELNWIILYTTRRCPRSSKGKVHAFTLKMTT